MPSKGNQILKFRCPPELVQEIRTTIARRNLFSKETPWTLSDFLEIAAVEKIRKMERSRGERPGFVEVEERPTGDDTMGSADEDSSSFGEPRDV